jgi:anaerobic ribonucleoside-triphosphate reductase activating protein
MNATKNEVLNLANWTPLTGAEGQGRRFAMWLQGCPIRCEHCCNPEMWAFTNRHLLSLSELLQLITQSQNTNQIEGISCLGGEPFAQASALSKLARSVQQLNLSVVVFSGYTLEQIESHKDPTWQDLLKATDLLIDGPFIQAQKTTNHRWIGSLNQRVHFLSSRYNAQDPTWQQPNSIDLHFDGEAIYISGFPTNTLMNSMTTTKKL